MTSKIAQRAVIARVNIGRWSPWKKDRSLASSVAEEKKANPKKLHASKQLVDREAVRALNRVLNECYIYHKSHTLQTGTEGDRLLPTSRIAEHEARLIAYRDRVEELLSEFLEVYPSYVQEARLEAKGLGLLWSEFDYPSAEELAQKYYIKWRYLPLPTSAEGLSVGNEQLRMINEYLQAEYEEIERQVRADLWVRLYEQTSYMASKLSSIRVTKDGNQEGAIFRDSLVSNVKELADLMDSLNVTDDAALSGAAQRIREALTKHNPEILRTNRVVRATVARDAETIAHEALGQLRAIRRDMITEPTECAGDIPKRLIIPV